MDKEELLFELYKDLCIEVRKFRAILKKQFKIEDKKITDIYAKINNYQIQKYGKRIEKDDQIDFKTKEDLKRVSINRRTARYVRRTKNGTKKSNI